MHNRTVVSLVLVILIVAAVIGVSRSARFDLPHPQERTNIAFILKDQDGEYWKSVISGAEAAAKEFNANLQLVAAGDETNAQRQAALIHEAVAGDAEAVVLAAGDDLTLQDEIRNASSERIPTVAIDTDVHTRSAVSFVGTSQIEAGKQAAQKIMELIPGKAVIGILGADRSATNRQLREQGLLQLLNANKLVSIAGQSNCQTITECQDLTRTFLNKEGLNGIVALDAVSAVAAAREIQRQSLSGRIKLVTFDTTPEALEHLQEGRIQATIVQNPFSIGYLGVKTAVDAAKGKKTPSHIETGAKVIDSSNMFWLDNQKLLFPFVN